MKPIPSNHSISQSMVLIATKEKVKEVLNSNTEVVKNNNIILPTVVVFMRYE